MRFLINRPDSKSKNKRTAKNLGWERDYEINVYRGGTRGNGQLPLLTGLRQDDSVGLRNVTGGKRL